jgi:hypothetical protein
VRPTTAEAANSEGSYRPFRFAAASPHQRPLPVGEGRIGPAGLRVPEGIEVRTALGDGDEAGSADRAADVAEFAQAHIGRPV